jgi:hypothetical protein
MIQEFVDKFMASEQDIKDNLRSERPGGYGDLVARLVTVLSEGGPDDYGAPDPQRIHVIDDGDYQGTKLYVIGAEGYQPSTYWVIFVNYGSCSGCDSFESIMSDGDWETVNDEQVQDLWSMMLHMVQSMKVIGE